MNKFKKPLLFSIFVLPVAIIAGICTAITTFHSYTAAIQQQYIAMLGSYFAVVAVSTVQTAMIAFFCAFFGYIISDKIGCMHPLKFKKDILLKTMIITILLGILFSLDYWVFGKNMPQIAQSYKGLTEPSSFLSAIFYGGVIEEIMLRLFFLSLVAFIIWKIFARKYTKEQIPKTVFVVANILAAVIFAAGHLPATIVVFGTLTPMLIFRCFLINGGFGIAFGTLYTKYGIQYAIFAHVGCHVISRCIWLLLV